MGRMRMWGVDNSGEAFQAEGWVLCLMSNLGLVPVTSTVWAQLGNVEVHFLLSSIYIAYCQVSAGRGSEERPAGFPPGLERLLQNGKFLEEV